MSKRRLKVVEKADSVESLRKALAKCAKGDLVDILVELARDNRNLFRRLSARFKLEAPPEELAAATRQAIADATDFDEREINRNFSYDYAAYGEVKRKREPAGQARAVAAGHGTLVGVDEARKLSGRNER